MANYRAPVRILITPSSGYPISVDDLGRQLGLSADMITVHTELLTLIIAAVTESAELWTKRDFLTKVWDQLEDKFPGGYFLSEGDGIQLRKSPFQEVVLVDYLTNDDTTRTVVAASEYYIDLRDDYSNVVPTNNWPTDVSRRLQAVKIRFKSGYGDDPADVPLALTQALLQHGAYFYKNRGDCTCSSASATDIMPASAKATYNLYRIMWAGL